MVFSITDQYYVMIDFLTFDFSSPRIHNMFLSKNIRSKLVGNTRNKNIKSEYHSLTWFCGDYIEIKHSKRNVTWSTKRLYYGIYCHSKSKSRIIKFLKMQDSNSE